MYLEIAKEGILIVLIISGVPLVVSMVSGLVIALLQSATQIQEQSVQHIVKIATFCGVLLVGGAFFQNLLLRYFTECLLQAPMVAGG
ncbi:MAG: flagellar biosynthetic protein FliQ [Bdellovibrionales bacterium]|nr:flagellar biosynthetic protein FliQ [Bdellovibrionales bacterium]